MERAFFCALEQGNPRAKQIGSNNGDARLRPRDYLQTVRELQRVPTAAYMSQGIAQALIKATQFCAARKTNKKKSPAMARLFDEDRSRSTYLASLAI
jgi:hypothetical protein